MNIKEFAEKLGVSPTTVSRALSGRGRVSVRTRETIRNRMAELGYTPNVQAQRLITGRAYTVALDWSPPRGQSSTLDFFFAQLIEGIQVALQRQGYGLLLGGPHNSQLVQHWVAGRAVDGVLYISDNDEEQIATEISVQGAPCVLVGHRPVEGIAGVGSVVLDLETGAREVADALIQHGHDRIAYVGSRPRDAVLDAFREELVRQGRQLPDSHVFIAGATVEEGTAILERVLKSAQRPTAIFARTDLLAVGILRAARSLGLRVPDDFSLVGHDDIRIAEWVDPPLTTVRINYARLGEEAAEMILRLIEEPERIAATSVLHTHLVMRSSLSSLSGGPS